jgi:hypothetical protein
MRKLPPILQLRKLGEGVRNGGEAELGEVKCLGMGTACLFNAAGRFCGLMVLSLRGHTWIPG